VADRRELASLDLLGRMGAFPHASFARVLGRPHISTAPHAVDSTRLHHVGANSGLVAFAKEHFLRFANRHQRSHHQSASHKGKSRAATSTRMVVGIRVVAASAVHRWGLPSHHRAASRLGEGGARLRDRRLRRLRGCTTTSTTSVTSSSARRSGRSPDARVTQHGPDLWAIGPTPVAGGYAFFVTRTYPH
jgi:hypothetical protein